MQHKRCIHCKEEKLTSLYDKSSSCSDGLTPACKECRRIQRQRRESKHKISADSKECKRCGLSKKAKFFLANKSNKDGLNGWCKDCTKDSMLLKKYNISHEDYFTILEKQNHKCAICSTYEPLGPTGVFVVDHDHKTGKVRGLLCNHCNTGLGKLGDTVESLTKAIRYLSSC